jgi:hypothetical protein
MTIENLVQLTPSVLDRGILTRYVPWRGQTQMLISRKIEPSREHRAVLWTRSGKIRTVAVRHGELGNRRWILADCPDADAWAVALEGRRLGSGWRESQLAALIRSKTTVENFALLRWFRAPVLGPEMREALLQSVAQRPVEFLQSWMGGRGLPDGLRHAEVPEELYPVIRTALWDVHILSPNQATSIWALFVARAPTGATLGEQDTHVWAAQRLAQLCAPFAGRVLTKVKKGNKLAKRAYRALLGLANESPMSAGDGHLQGLLRRGSYLLGIDEAALGKAALDLADGSPSGAHAPALRRLAESPEGARYLAALVLRVVAEGNSHPWTPQPSRIRTVSASSKM